MDRFDMWALAKALMDEKREREILLLQSLHFTTPYIIQSNPSTVKSNITSLPNLSFPNFDSQS